MRKQILMAMVGGLLVVAFAQPGWALTLLDPFDPDYPAGASYDTYTDTLDDLGYLSDSTDIPGFSENDTSLKNERCSTNMVADLKIAVSALFIAQAVAQGVCGGLAGVPIGEAIACGVAGALLAAAIGTNIPIEQCDFQDGNVDSAELEATYENSRTAIFAANSIRLELDATNTTVNTINSTVNTINGTVNTINTTANLINATVNTINTTANAINTTVNTINTTANAINTTVNTINTKVDTLTAKVNTAMDWLKEVIRLLHTPDGQRTSAVPACNGGPCTWNPK